MAKILFIGDVVGKPGRKVLREVLPQWKEKYQPDVVIVNVENLAHGKGVTINTIEDLGDLKIDAYTSGNHVFDKKALSNEVFEKYPNLIRPGNFEGNLPGYGYYRFAKPVVRPFMGINQTADKSADYVNQQFLVVNLNATVFMESQFDGPITNPFLALDGILTQQSQKGDIIIVDFHSEATSEKIAFGYYCDGRVTAVLGTHTHVPTADARVLPKGTAYVSDTGMTGSRDGVIGVKFENVIQKFLNPESKFKNEPEDEGVLQINGVLIQVSEGGKASSIEKLYSEVAG